VTDDEPQYDPGALVPQAWFDSNPDAMPTAVVVVVEATDAEGQPSFHRITSNDCPDWRAIGLLRSGVLHAEEVWRMALHDDE
jgi:hypothetical protein